MKKHPYDFAKNESENTGNPENGAEEATVYEERREQPTEACANCDASEEAAQRAMAEAEEIRLRALADADNARKRFLREKDEAIRFAASGVLSDIIPALDNLDLALEHAKSNAACKDFFVGVEMTRKLLLEALQKHGLTRVGEIGDEFDPTVHEALSMVSSDEVPEGCVAVLMNRGYKLHDRLLRPAKVLVCKK